MNDLPSLVFCFLVKSLHFQIVYYATATLGWSQDSGYRERGPPDFFQSKSHTQAYNLFFKENTGIYNLFKENTGIQFVFFKELSISS